MEEEKSQKKNLQNTSSDWDETVKEIKEMEKEIGNEFGKRLTKATIEALRKVT